MDDEAASTRLCRQSDASCEMPISITFSVCTNLSEVVAVHSNLVQESNALVKLEEKRNVAQQLDAGPLFHRLVNRIDFAQQDRCKIMSERTASIEINKEKYLG